MNLLNTSIVFVFIICLFGPHVNFRFFKLFSFITGTVSRMGSIPVTGAVKCDGFPAGHAAVPIEVFANERLLTPATFSSIREALKKSLFFNAGRCGFPCAGIINALLTNS